jgi:hypothetical protein
MLKVIMLENAENKFFSLIFFLNIPLLSRSLLIFVVPKISILNYIILLYPLYTTLVVPM